MHHSSALLSWLAAIMNADPKVEESIVFWLPLAVVPLAW